MSTLSFPLVLGLLGAGIVGGLTTHLLTPAPAAAKSADNEALSPALANVDIGPLSSQLASISKRLEMLEAGEALSSRRPASENPLLLPSEQLEQAVAAAIDSKVANTSSMQNMVASTLDQIRAQEDVQKEIERDQQRQDALQRRIDRLTEDLGLYPDQAAKMLDILGTEDAARNEMRDAMRGGTGDFTTMRDDMNALRETSKLAVSGVLSAEQLEKYNASNMGGGGFGGGRGNRGGN